MPVRSYNGWAVLSANGPFSAAMVRLPKAGQPISYAPVTSSKNLYLPYIKKAGTTSSSVINLANTSTTLATVQIAYYDQSGHEIITDTRQLAIFGQYTPFHFQLKHYGSERNLCRFGGNKFKCAACSLSGDYPLSDGTYATYPAVTSSGAQSQVNFYKNTNGISTALVVQNDGKDAASVKIDFIDQSGNTVASSTQNVPSFGQVTIGGDALKDAANFQGKAQITASGGNISVIAVSGATILQNQGQQFP